MQDRAHINGRFAIGAVLLGTASWIAHAGDCYDATCGPYSSEGYTTTWGCSESEEAVVPDRRPVKWLPLFGGNPAESPYIRSSWEDCDDDGTVVGVGYVAAWDGNGIADSWDWFLGTINTYYDEGWRRFMFALPAGAKSAGQQVLPASQYWTMPDWMREGWTTYISATGDGMTPGWLYDHQDATIGIYAGFPIHDPCDLCNNPAETGCSGSDSHAIPECGTGMQALIDAEIVFQNIHPWMDIVGISEYWFDYAGDITNTSAYLKLITAPLYDDLHFGAEAIPAIEDPGNSSLWIPDPDVVDRTPAVATHAWIRDGNGVASTSALTMNSGWDYSGDTADTELGVIIDDQHFGGSGGYYYNSPTRILSLVGLYKAKGYVVWAGYDGAAATEEAVKRHHWPGQWPGNLASLNLNCPEDLNMDGVVNSGDLAIVFAGWGTGGRTLAQGDLTGEGNVDSTDQSMVLGAWGACP